MAIYRKRHLRNMLVSLHNMVSSDTKRFHQCQRINVVRDCEGTEKNLKISVERYDDVLGWYSAGALSIPLHQLPLLQQALAEASAAECVRCPDTKCTGKIIPFPTCMPEFGAVGETGNG